MHGEVDILKYIYIGIQWIPFFQIFLCRYNYIFLQFNLRTKISLTCFFTSSKNIFTLFFSKGSIGMITSLGWFLSRNLSRGRFLSSYILETEYITRWIDSQEPILLHNHNSITTLSDIHLLLLLSKFISLNRCKTPIKRSLGLCTVLYISKLLFEIFIFDLSVSPKVNFPTKWNVEFVTLKDSFQINFHKI